MFEENADLLLFLQSKIQTTLKHWHKPARQVFDKSLLDIFLIYNASFDTRIPVDVNQAVEHFKALILDTLNRVAVHEPDLTNPVRDKYIYQKSMTSLCLDYHFSESTFYRNRQRAVELMARSLLLLELEQRRKRRITQLRHLLSPSYDILFGVERTLHEIITLLRSDKGPGITLVSGIGGIGKTALVDAAIRTLIKNRVIERPVWVRYEIKAGFPENDPKKTFEFVVRAICKELFPEAGIQPFTTQLEIVQKELRHKRYIVVVDNLEEESDTHFIVEQLAPMTGTTHFIITTRTSTHYDRPIHALHLGELSETDAQQLFLDFARVIGVRVLPQEEELFHDIFRVTGGNPLAIKIVTGFLDRIPLYQVLDFLKVGRIRSVEIMYRRIYQHAWQLLSPDAKNLLLAMPLVGSTGCTFDTLCGMTGMSAAQTRLAARELSRRSLLIADRHENVTRYSVHRLTETFLFTEIIGDFD